MSPKPANKSTNRLSKEKSPYLLQHQYNPVDWYAWGEEAFTRARTEKKPIFLSIGYSTCHWCHVMERESFENEEVARFLKAHFISIKVDREERPDVDKIYMSFVQATSGHGGWPLNVFLTPERKPFYGGTYFPPDNRQGRPSFLQVLQNVANLWKTRPEEIVASAAQLHGQLEKMSRQETAKGLVLTPDLLQSAGIQLKRNYDAANGGFGSAPKFPSPSHPAYLLRYGKRFGDQGAIAMVLHTCDKMAAGGIYDQLGGGFSRYSVDAQWLVPHFEKMLYDNAQLLDLYLDAHLVSREEKYAAVARDIIRYLQRDMLHAKGGFFSAEDADSEGKEGKFYTWTVTELKDLLKPEELAVATKHFGLTAKGNFVDHSDPEPLADQNVLSIVSTDLGSKEAPLLASARAKMFSARSKRVRPHLDDKVLSSWNGLLLGALARAGILLKDKKVIEMAERNVAFVREHLWDESTATLYHRWRDGARDQVQLLDAYAFYLNGLLHLYEVTLRPEHLEFALKLAKTMRSKFEDREHGGFWQSGAGSTDLILRVKEDYDGAEPSGNSVAVLALLRLGKITGDNEWSESAEKALRHFAPRLRDLPAAVPFMLMALDFWVDEPRRIVIAGDRTSTPVQALLQETHGVFLPHKVVMGNTGPVDPFSLTLKSGTDGARAYVCSGTECSAPVSKPEALRALLRNTGNEIKLSPAPSPADKGIKP